MKSKHHVEEGVHHVKWQKLVWFSVAWMAGGVVTGVCGELDLPARPQILDPTPAVARTIEDITVGGGLLKQEDFRVPGQIEVLTLQQAIDIALEQNPQMRIAESAVDESLANLDLTESNYRAKLNLDTSLNETIRRRSTGTFRLDPNLGLISDEVKSYENNTLFQVGPRYTQNFKNGSFLEIAPEFQYESDSEGAFDRGPGNPDGNNYEDRYSLSASYNFPINSRPREEIKTRIDNSRLSTIRSDYSLYMRSKQTTNQVITNYWNIKRLQDQLVIQQERLLQSRRIEFIRQTQYEFENASRQQVGEAQVNVLQDETTLIELEGSLRNAIENFNLVLGIPIDTQLELTDELTVEPLPLSGRAYIGMVTSSNLQLQSIRLSIQQAENNLRVALLGQQPDLVMSSFASTTDEGQQNLGVGLIFSWPFSDGGATKARVRAAQETIKQLQTNLWDSERNLVQQTYSDLRDLQLQQQRMDILQRNVDLATINLENGLYDFENFGQITFRDVQDLQVELARNRADLVNSKVLYNISRSNLMQKIHDYQPSEPVQPVWDALQ